MTTVVKCPHCKKSVVWNQQNTYRPFCSKRCRLIDFGDWADENHKVSLDLQPELTAEHSNEYIE